jgi:hypothetical protein
MDIDPARILEQMRHTRFGYVVENAKEAGWEPHMKKMPEVAGVAAGGPNQLNGDQNPERIIVVNPYNKHMNDPRKRDALLKLEAARHLMDEKKTRLNFAITPEMQAWREKKFKKGVDPYADNDDAFRETIISRLIVDDDAPPVSKEIAEYARSISEELDRREPQSNRHLNNVGKFPAR